MTEPMNERPDLLALQRSTQALALKSQRRRVVCAANRNGDTIAIGVRHGCPLMRINMHALGMDLKHPTEQGFVDQFGVFLTRAEARSMALDAGQVEVENVASDILFSEDLY